MKIYRELIRLTGGLLFIFSGLSKGIDPSGSMYKFIDYFTAFGLDSLNNTALVAGIALSTVEFIIGFALVSGIRAREAGWGMLAMMAIFTPLTLFLALGNPVSDCGCFGDAIHLTNWQTFIKNVVITAIAIAIVLEKGRMARVICPSRGALILISATTLFLIFSLYNYRYLPLSDFRPYAEGVSITEGKTIPDGAPMDEYEVTLIYEKDGVEQEFTLDNYPSDPEWNFVDQKSRLVKKGYTPPIHDFILTDIYGTDQTDEILQYEGLTILMVSTRLGEAPPEAVSFGSELSEQALQAGFRFHILTSSGSADAVQHFDPLLYLSGDETMLKTVIRSNPGYLLIREGIILKKWPWRRMQSVPEITEDLESYLDGRYKNSTLIFMIIVVLATCLSWVTGYLAEITERRVK